MIYITGDMHGDASKVGNKNFQVDNPNEQNYLIITGDFGFIWQGGRKGSWWLNWFENKNFTTLFVDGNHENFDLLETYPQEYWNGGKIHKINEKVFHLMRGQVFEIEGKKIFTMGGAESNDKTFSQKEKNLALLYGQKLYDRKEGVDWWSNEMPNDYEYEEALSNLKKHNFKVDYIITHAAPTSIQQMLDTKKPINQITDFFEDLKNKVDFEHWYFGHYHVNKQMEKFTCIYNSIEKKTCN